MCYRGFALSQSCLRCYPPLSGGMSKRSKSLFPECADRTFAHSQAPSAGVPPGSRCQASSILRDSTNLRSYELRECTEMCKIGKERSCSGLGKDRNQLGKSLILDFIRWEQIMQSQHPEPRKTGPRLFFVWRNFLFWFLTRVGKSLERIYSANPDLLDHLTKSSDFQDDFLWKFSKYCVFLKTDSEAKHLC